MASFESDLASRPPKALPVNNLQDQPNRNIELPQHKSLIGAPAFGRLTCQSANDDATAAAAGAVVHHKICLVAAMPLPMHYATTRDGVRIAYMSLGDGPPLVFASNIFGDLSAYLGGWPATREVTDRCAAGMAGDSLPRARNGLADRNVDDVELAGRVLDLEAVVAALHLDRFALAGLDIGAATAVAYAVANQANVSRLILLSPWSSRVKSFRDTSVTCSVRGRGRCRIAIRSCS